MDNKIQEAIDDLKLDIDEIMYKNNITFDLDRLDTKGDIYKSYSYTSVENNKFKWIALEYNSETEDVDIICIHSEMTERNIKEGVEDPFVYNILKNKDQITNYFLRKSYKIKPFKNAK